jgi:hypothetical protein
MQTETKLTIQIDNFKTVAECAGSTDSQTSQNRITRAAIYVAQGALVLRQEGAESLSGRNALHLRSISEGLQNLVPLLERIGRALDNPERILPPSVCIEARISLEAAS